MKSKNDEATQRVLMLLKIDANNIFQRIKVRKNEYLEIFALRRTREHFPMIFKNRYEGTSIMDLSHCSVDLITTLDKFYSLVDEMNWYLFYTQDMPNTVEDYIGGKIRKMEKLLETLNLYLDAELGIEGGQQGLASDDLLLGEDPFTESAIDDTPQET
jgi:hypothetical protein